MSKKIKTTDTNLRVDTSTCLVVDINGTRFVLDERYPWIEILELCNSEYYKNIDEIDEDFVTEIRTLEDLKVVAMNWYFNNVEIVKASN